MDGPGFKNITVMGLGLMGGSLCLAVRKALPKVRITGVDCLSVLARARRLNAIHESVEWSAPNRALPGRDLIVLAAPVAVILDLLPQVLRCAEPSAVVTDLGSTKETICARAWSVPGPACAFIGGHPLCGSEDLGIGRAASGLYSRASYVLTPRSVDRGTAVLENLADFVSALGARPVVMDPDDHDRVLARTSHLPQLLAVALANLAGRSSPGERLWAGGFRDLTRIASSPPALWMDILQSNAKNIHEALGSMIDELGELRARLAQGDVQGLSALFSEAGGYRRRTGSPC